MKKKFLSLVLVLLCMLTAVGCSIRKIEPLPTMDDYKDSAAKYSLEVTDKSVTGIACAQGRNLITEKYGRMMESTAPDRYAEIADSFPEIPEMKKRRTYDYAAPCQ